MNDPFGEAISDYFKYGSAPDLVVNSNYTENETIPVEYLFRSFDQMPKIEQKALQLCRGKILDVGAAAGCHSIILLEKGFDVTAVEVSPLVCEVLHARKIPRVVRADILAFSGQKFDTILLLMNGAGIGKTVSGLKELFQHLKTLLNPNGQILIDSSDIKYLFEEEDGSLWIDLNNPAYYGEMKYEVQYKKTKSVFDWLFIDFDLMKKTANSCGLKCDLIIEGNHNDYLAKIWK